MRTIYITNETSKKTDAEIAKAAAAVQIQLDRDFAPAYRGITAKLVAAPRGQKPPDKSETIHCLDTSDVADAEGYHDDGRNGPEGYVFVETTESAGDNWTVTLSHEIMEQVLDPNAAALVRVRLKVGGPMVCVPVEACDAVEADAYPIDGVSVSNFVLPLWFTGAVGKVDFLGKLARGITLDGGGYFEYSTTGVSWQQISGKLTPFSRNGRYLQRLVKSARHNLTPVVDADLSAVLGCTVVELK